MASENNYDEYDDSDDEEDLKFATNPLYTPSSSTSTSKASHAPEKKRKRKPAVKIEAKWTDEELGQLIGEVELHQCLYDASCMENHNKFRRDAAWQEVVTSFEGKFPASQCKAKWGGLRQTYRRKVAEINASARTGVTKKHQNWKFFNRLSFLIVVDEKNALISKSQLSLDTESNHEQSPTMDNNDSLSTSEFELRPMNIVTVQSNRIKRKKKIASPISPVEQQSDASSVESKTKIVPTMEAIVESMGKRATAHPSEFQAFGMFVASELDSIADVNDAKELKLKLQVALVNGMVKIANKAKAATFVHKSQQFQQPSQQRNQFAYVQAPIESSNRIRFMSNDEIRQMYKVTNETGDKFDKKVHKNMLVWIEELNEYADLQTHKQIAAMYGLEVDASHMNELEFGVAVKPKEPSKNGH